MFGAIGIGIGIAIIFLNNQDIISGSPINGPYLLSDGTDILLCDGTPLLLS